MISYKNGWRVLLTLLRFIWSEFKSWHWWTCLQCTISHVPAVTSSGPPYKAARYHGKYAEEGGTLS